MPILEQINRVAGNDDTLTTLNLNERHGVFTKDHLVALTAAIKENTHLKSLKLGTALSGVINQTIREGDFIAEPEVIAFFKQLAANKHIEEVVLYGNTLSYADSASIETLIKGSTSIKKLNLNNTIPSGIINEDLTNRTNTYYQAIANGLGENETLEELSLERNFWTADAIKNVFEALTENEDSALKVLSLSHGSLSKHDANLDPAHFQPLADYLASDPSLERLDLSSCYLGVETIKLILEALKENTNLKALDIRVNLPLDEHGENKIYELAEAVADLLKVNKGITEIKVGEGFDNKFSDEAIEKIAEAFDHNYTVDDFEVCGGGLPKSISDKVTRNQTIEAELDQIIKDLSERLKGPRQSAYGVFATEILSIREYSAKLLAHLKTKLDANPNYEKGKELPKKAHNIILDYLNQQLEEAVRLDRTKDIVNTAKTLIGGKYNFNRFPPLAEAELNKAKVLIAHCHLKKVKPSKDSTRRSQRIDKEYQQRYIKDALEILKDVPENTPGYPDFGALKKEFKEPLQAAQEEYTRQANRAKKKEERLKAKDAKLDAREKKKQERAEKRRLKPKRKKGTVALGTATLVAGVLLIAEALTTTLTILNHVGIIGGIAAGIIGGTAGAAIGGTIATAFAVLTPIVLTAGLPVAIAVAAVSAVLGITSTVFASKTLLTKPQPADAEKPAPKKISPALFGLRGNKDQQGKRDEQAAIKDIKQISENRKAKHKFITILWRYGIGKASDYKLPKDVEAAANTAGKTAII